MNTATQCVRTTCVLSIALLICGTTVATQISEYTQAKLYPKGYEALATGPSSCASDESRAVVLDGVRQTLSSCNDSSQPASISPSPVRLARPLSDRQYIRSGDGIRYSF